MFNVDIDLSPAVGVLSIDFHLFQPHGVLLAGATASPMTNISDGDAPPPRQ